jgi:vacuolar-type H+-ATPase subunit I/STV1
MVDARRLRLDAVGAGLPGGMWLVLILGAAICLLGSCFFPVDDARLHFLYQGLLAALMGMILYMTFAWDRPYHGEYGVTSEPYQLIYDHLMR